jgi:hypothetical protein
LPLSSPIIQMQAFTVACINLRRGRIKTNDLHNFLWCKLKTTQQSHIAECVKIKTSLQAAECRLQRFTAGSVK